MLNNEALDNVANISDGMESSAPRIDDGIENSVPTTDPKSSSINIHLLFIVIRFTCNMSSNADER